MNILLKDEQLTRLFFNELPSDLSAIIIKAMGEHYVVDVLNILFIFVVLVGGVVFCLYLIYTNCFVLSTNLSEAFEFSNALSSIGYMKPKEQIDFIRRNSIPVYVSNEPIIQFSEKNIKAKLLPIEFYPLMHQRFFNQYTGNKSLCIAKGDYDEDVN